MGEYRKAEMPVRDGVQHQMRTPISAERVGATRPTRQVSVAPRQAMASQMQSNGAGTLIPGQDF